MKLTRVFEVIPGVLSWGTIFLMLILSWSAPAAAAVFIILFDTYWLLKTLFLSLHFRVTFKKVRENMKLNWLRKLKEDKLYKNWPSVTHLIIFPVSKEPYKVIRESFLFLASTNYPKEKFIVVLAMEENVSPSTEVAQKIQQEFGNSFSNFLVTYHPAGLPAEIPGKGSNETWAARQAKEKIIDPLGVSYENILVSVFDADTQILPEYFGILTYTFLTAEHPQRSSYQPIPLFTNNVFQATALARVVSFSTTFWNMIQQARKEKLTTFSSHSMPFKALVEIGFWQTNVVSEDSRIFWQCFLHYNGDWRVVPITYPVSMDANVAPTFWQTMFNIYKQQRRWGWGCENIPYFLDGFVRNKKISLKTKLYWTFHYIEGFHSWATNAMMIFSLGWLPVILGGQAFGVTVLSYNLPRVTRILMTFAMVGIVSSAISSIILLPPKPDWFKTKHYFLYLLQWLLMPLTLIIFGSIPALEAQTRLMLGGKRRLGFWVTPKYR